ncbi:shikimate dehydrogenase [Segnochrobactraceae bacterium EtOH-i3]
MTEPKAAVIGWPIAQSRSPLIHGTWLKSLGISGRYDRIALPVEGAADWFARFADHGLVGANVTVPHKETAFAACAEVEPEAAALGACNTLWLEDGRLFGTNTDTVGFLANLDDRAPGWDANAGPAVVLGAGGAARAIVWALARRGFSPIRIVNRTLSRAEAIAPLGAPSVVTVHGFDELPKVLADARLLVNTTALGMAGKDDLVIDLTGLPEDALVTDIVYVPLETALLAAARRRGNPTVDGLGMLLHQAVPGFERWFGVRPVVTEELRRIILADLGVPA